MPPQPVKRDPWQGKTPGTIASSGSFTLQVYCEWSNAMRSRILSFVGLTFVLLALLAAQPVRPAYACSCVSPPDPATALADASAVFVGTVLSTEVRDGPVMSSGDPVRVTFDVAQVWKGPTETPLVVITARDSATCGFGFQPGAEYIVYAYTWESSDLQTNICTRTAPSSSQTVLEDLRVLGQGTVPSAVAQAEPSPQVPPDTGPGTPTSTPPALTASTLLLIGIGSLVLLGGLAWMLRRWVR
jgi:hypothetical protein